MRVGVLLAAVLCATVLAGCSDGSDPTETVEPQRELAAGKGAVSGLLIDDIYRPIPGGLILLQGAGLTATTDELGQFEFLDVTPGSYIAIATAENHEASPVNVDVEAGIYADLEVRARRLFSEGGQIVTTQFSAFIPCAADFVVNGVVANCVADLSGDSYRAGFTTENVTGLKNITYMVTEAKMNKVGNYMLQVRENNGSPGGGDRYAVGAIKNSDYIKLTNEFNVTNTEHNEQDNNVPWTGDKPFTTIVFYQGQFKDEATGPGAPGICCGAGAEFGIKATFVQSIFLGEPDDPVAEYHVMGPSE